jgi:hypothetical protein
MADISLTLVQISELPPALGRDIPAGGAGSVGDVVYVNATDQAQKCDASAIATAKGWGIVTAVENGAQTFASGDMVHVAFFGPVTGFSGLTSGARQYVSETAGKLADAAPSAADSVVWPFSFALDASTIFVLPFAPVPQTKIASLTDSTTGAANDTLTDVGAAFNQATLNNNFADVAAKINAILAALRANGIVINS